MPVSTETNTFSDYLDMQMRDPEDRAEGITIGAGRAILSNRISHFLNIRGARYDHLLTVRAFLD